MKTRILFISILSLVFSVYMFGQNTALDKFFNDYLEDPSFTVVNISPKMFQMISKLDIDDIDPEVNELINSLDRLKILVKENGDGLTLFNEAHGKINKNEFEELMTIRDKDENVRIYVKDAGDIINELILLVGSHEEFVLLDITGKIDLKTIGKLGNTLDAPGIKHLNKLGN